MFFVTISNLAPLPPQRAALEAQDIGQRRFPPHHQRPIVSRIPNHAVAVVVLAPGAPSLLPRLHELPLIGTLLS